MPGKKPLSSLPHIILIVSLSLMLSACKKDTSVLLAECINKAQKALVDTGQQSINRSCDVNMKGNYLAILHPAKNLDDAELKTYGLDDREIKTLRTLQIPNFAYESIYIIPLDDQEPPSRTTSQGGAVNVLDFISAKKDNPVLTITIEQTPTGINIVGLQ